MSDKSSISFGILQKPDFKKHSLFSQSSVQTSAKLLLDKEIITSENNVYQVYDRFFGLWLKTVFGTGYRL